MSEPSEPSGTDRERNQRIVDEILELTGNKLNGQKQPQTEEDKAIRRFELANMEVAKAVREYYEDHPLMTNVAELRRIIWSIYNLELCKWNKDDLIFMLALQQTSLAMKRFGY